MRYVGTLQPASVAFLNPHTTFYVCPACYSQFSKVKSAVNISSGVDFYHPLQCSALPLACVNLISSNLVKHSHLILCVHVSVHSVCVCVCMCTSVCVCVKFVYVCMCTWMCMNMYVCSCTFVCVCVLTRVHMSSHMEVKCQ